MNSKNSRLTIIEQYVIISNREQTLNKECDYEQDCDVRESKPRTVRLGRI